MRAPHKNETPLPAGGDAGFDFGDRAVDQLHGALAMPAFVPLRILQGGACVTQMRQRISHPRLIRANRLKTHGRDRGHEHQACFQCFHVSV